MSEPLAAETTGEVLGAQAIERLDAALLEASAALANVAEHVNAGHIPQDELMLRLHQFAASLGQPMMGG